VSANAFAFTRRAVEHVNSRFDVSSFPVGDPQRFNEFAREHGMDRRFRFHFGALSTGGAAPCASGIVTYRGVRVYFYVDAAGTVITPDDWQTINVVS
jgi:hypothetical protein